MRTPTLTDNPYALAVALRRVDARQRAAAQRRLRPGLLQRLCKRPAPPAQREHICRLPGGEVITSNLPRR